MGMTKLRSIMVEVTMPLREGNAVHGRHVRLVGDD